MINRSDCLLILYTFNKRHRYLPYIDFYVSKNLNFFEKVLITNKHVEFSSEVFFNTEKDFVRNLLFELKKIKKIYNPKSVFLLLEDLFPFYPVPIAILLEDINLVLSSNIKNISFRTYDFGDIEFNYSLNNRFYHSLDKDFKYFCQLQPSIWNLEYLMLILEELNSKNILDPWSFEFHKTNEVHLVSNYRWPNILGGFFESGFVNIYSILPIFNFSPRFALILAFDLFLSIPRYLFYRVTRYFC
jgi:hypothetical protein